MTKSIYLDTQHISRAVSNKNRISEFISEASLSFSYSLSHVIECLPKEATENKDAIKRLEMIMAPGANSLAGWAVVAEIEKTKSLCTVSDFTVARSEMLFPNFSIDRKRWIKKAREDLKQALGASIPDGNVRRSIQAKFLKHGKLTPAAFNFLREEIKKHESRISSEIPQLLPLIGSDGLYDFLEGKISERSFSKMFIDALGSPVALASLSLMPDLASILDISKFFWLQMDEFAEIVSRLIANLIEAQLHDRIFDYRKVRSQTENYLSSEAYASAIVYRTTGHKTGFEDLKKMPGTRLFVEVSAQYVLEKMDEYANVASRSFGIRPKFKRSDIADLMHVFYCPYVDVFGCDRAMRERLKRAGWENGNVVTGDAELEQRLSNMVNSNCD